MNQVQLAIQRLNINLVFPILLSLIIFSCGGGTQAYELDKSFFHESCCGEFPTNYTVIDSGMFSDGGYEKRFILKLTSHDEINRFEQFVLSNSCPETTKSNTSPCGCWVIDESSYTFVRNNEQRERGHFLMMEYSVQSKKLKIIEVKDH
jgi:hypothetical protein